MEYNTTRNKLIIREYGRNIQKMIEYVITIEDPEKRTRYARFIVNIMGQMNPQIKESGDYKHKLWDHLFFISGNRLEVEAPYTKPSLQIFDSRPEKVKYRSNSIKFKPYGANIQTIIQAAILMEDGPEKEALTANIANHLKKAYLSWNRDSVTDDVIFEHLDVLSGGKLKLPENFKLSAVTEILSKKQKKKQKAQKNGQGQYPSPNKQKKINR